MKKLYLLLALLSLLSSCSKEESMIENSIEVWEENQSLWEDFIFSSTNDKYCFEYYNGDFGIEQNYYVEVRQQNKIFAYNLTLGFEVDVDIPAVKSMEWFIAKAGELIRNEPENLIDVQYHADNGYITYLAYNRYDSVIGEIRVEYNLLQFGTCRVF